MRLATRLREFRRRHRVRSTSGSAAIEFAFIAPVFFVLLFGIIEGGIMFFGKAALQNAVQDAAREIRTGQAQTGSMSSTTFTNLVCQGINILLNCGNLTVDVRSYPAGFSAADMTPPATDADGNLVGAGTYSPGNACDVVVVRGFYKYTVVTPVVSGLLTGGKGYNYLAAAAAFRNEPYGANPC